MDKKVDLRKYIEVTDADGNMVRFPKEHVRKLKPDGRTSPDQQVHVPSLDNMVVPFSGRFGTQASGGHRQRPKGSGYPKRLMRGVEDKKT